MALAETMGEAKGALRRQPLEALSTDPTASSGAAQTPRQGQRAEALAMWVSPLSGTGSRNWKGPGTGSRA